MTHPSPFLTQVSPILKARRLALGLTQQDLARLSNVPQFRISQIEQATSFPPTIATLVKLASSLNLDLTLTLTPLESRPLPQEVSK